MPRYAANPTGSIQRPDPFTQASFIAFARVFLGLMWLIEVTIGENWKLGGFGSGGDADWIGTDRGDAIREQVAEAIDDGTWTWFAELFEAVVVPNAGALSWFVIAAQATLGVVFLLGVFVRPFAVAAITMDLGLSMLGSARVPPLFLALHLFVLATGAGRYYGVDGYLLAKLEGATTRVARVVRGAIELPIFDGRHRMAAIAVSSLVGIYFLLSIPGRETEDIQYVALGLAAILGIVALCLHRAALGADTIAVAVAGLRIFVGFKFLYEIWVRTEPGVNALPGWAGGQDLEEFLVVLADHHWAPIATLVETVFLPAVGFWAIVFGVVQFAVGVALVVGLRTRLAATVGCIFLATLLVLGATRYAPFLLGMLIPVLALDGGRELSLDRPRAGRHYRPRFGLGIGRRAHVVLWIVASLGALTALVAAFVTGVEPGEYEVSMPAVSAMMVSIFSGLLAAAEYLRLRAVIPITSTDALQRLDTWG